MDDNNLWSRFSFDIPIELIKAEEIDNGWKIKGLASTEDVDMQGEVVKQHGLDVTPIKKGHGWINYNHSNEPEDIIGKLDDAEITTDGLMVEGYLFKKHNRAKAVYQIMKSLDDKDRRAVKLSIEGKIQKRSGKESKVIAAAKVDKVAITLDPINVNTYVELMKAMTDKTKEWEMEDLKSPQDDASPQNDPANATGESTGVETRQENDGMSPSEPNLENSKNITPDVHELLTEIAGTLKQLVDALVLKPEEARKAQEFKNDIAKGLSNILRKKLNITEE